MTNTTDAYVQVRFSVKPDALQFVRYISPVSGKVSGGFASTREGALRLTESAAAVAAQDLRTTYGDEVALEVAVVPAAEFEVDRDNDIRDLIERLRKQARKNAAETSAKFATFHNADKQYRVWFQSTLTSGSWDFETFAAAKAYLIDQATKNRVSGPLDVFRTFIQAPGGQITLADLSECTDLRRWHEDAAWTFRADLPFNEPGVVAEAPKPTAGLDRAVSEAVEAVAYLEGLGYDAARHQLGRASELLDSAIPTDALEYVNEAIANLTREGLDGWSSAFATRNAAVALRAAALLLTAVADYADLIA